MSLKRFACFIAIWFAICALLIEPTWVTPYFVQPIGIEVVYNGALSELDSSPPVLISNANDHTRVLLLIYFGIPCWVYLLSYHLRQTVRRSFASNMIFR